MEKKMGVVFAREGGAIEAKGAVAPIVRMDGTAVPGCIYTDAGWYRAPMEMEGLSKHDSGEVLMFLGSDHDHPEALNAEIQLQIENDVLTLTKTCAVYIPKGAAHGNLKVKHLNRPVMYCCCHPDTDTYHEEPAQATAPAGTYTANFVDRYDTEGVELPNVREGVMTRLYYLDSRRVPGAPYFESVWFNIPTEAFLEAHVHELDELIFFAGADAEHPEDLGGKIIFYVDGKPVEMTRSCILFIPAGIPHTPFEILEMKQPCLHFSGGNNSNYHRG